MYTTSKTVHVLYECVQVSQIEICLTNNLFFCFYFCYAINVLQLEIVVVVVAVVCRISIFNLGFYVYTTFNAFRCRDNLDNFCFSWSKNPNNFQCLFSTTVMAATTDVGVLATLATFSKQNRKKKIFF